MYICHILFIHSSVDGIHLSALVNDASMHCWCVSVSLSPSFPSLWGINTSAIAGLYGSSIFNILRNQAHAFLMLTCCCCCCCCFCSFMKSYPTLCDPMDCSTPGFPVPFIISGACSNSCPLSQWCYPSISPCHPLLLPSVFPSTSIFSNELALHIR